MVAAYVGDLERLVSRARLDRFRPSNRDDLETAVNYLWNAALAEAILPTIAAVEVALRNAIHNALTSKQQTDQWFWGVLRKEDLKPINDAWFKYAERLKRPPTASKIIAELTLGYWPRLFESRYHDLWWDNQEALLNAVFPGRPHKRIPPTHVMGRDKIFQRLDLFKELRNWAFHTSRSCSASHVQARHPPQVSR